MKKSYIKFIVIAVVTLLFFYSIYLASSQKQTPATLPTATSTLSIPVSGGNVQIKDVTKFPQLATGDTSVIEQNENFSIVYFSSDKSFIITILSQPLEQNRQLAEEEFLNKLQIQQTDACKLKVSLTVPASVNSQLAGQDYGLSFCPNGKIFITNPANQAQ